MRLEELIRYARGEGRVDLLLTNCRLVNVLSGTVHRSTVAVVGDTVVGVGEEYGAKETVDLEGGYLAPGFIDAHVHLESSMVSVPQFARAVVPHGTTTVVTDCHEIANVMGVEGVRYMMESSAGLPLDVFVMLPSCVPATPLETSGADLGAEELKTLVGMPGVIGLGEMMNFPGVVAGDPAVVSKIELFQGGVIDGHAPGLSGKDLCAYIAAGPDSDHECTSAAEAEEKLKKGMYLFLREGTGAQNLLDLLPAVNAGNVHRCCFCTDDRHPSDLLGRGHIDSIIRMAVGAGTPAISAVQMATLNTARRFRLRDRGAVAVGYRADMVVFGDLEDFKVEMVFKDGRKVAERGQMMGDETEKVKVPPSTFDVAGFSADRLRITGGGRARVIGLEPGQIVTESLLLDVAVEGGEVRADPGVDVLKVAVVERHRGTGNVGLALVRGFGLKSGALASSVAHDSHNIIVVGASAPDMAAAVNRLVELGGGQVVVSGGDVKAELALPVAGLMSDAPLEDVAANLGRLNLAAGGLGCTLSDPFMAMSFLALPVMPELKLTDLGLVDVGEFRVVPLFQD